MSCVHLYSSTSQYMVFYDILGIITGIDLNGFVVQQDISAKNVCGWIHQIVYKWIIQTNAYGNIRQSISRGNRTRTNIFDPL